MPRLPRFGSREDTLMIRGFSADVRALADRVEVRHAVSGLRFAHLDPDGREITDIGNLQRADAEITVRLDRQSNPSAGGANLQLQVNAGALRRLRGGAGRGTTVAQVIVPASIYRVAFTCPESNVQRQLERETRGALLRSFASEGYGYSIVLD